MLQRIKYLGNSENNYKSYFDANCKSFDDLLDIVKSSDTITLKGITPCIESYINNSEGIPNKFIDTMIAADDSQLNAFATEAIQHEFNNLDKALKAGPPWYLWSNIPAIESLYNSNTLDSFKVRVLERSMFDFAIKALESISDLEPWEDINDYAYDLYDNVSLENMLNWENTRESIFDEHPKAVYTGDLIYNATPEDIRYIAREGVMSDIDVTLDDIAKVVQHANKNQEGSSYNYKNMVTEIWSALTEDDMTPARLPEKMEKLYFSMGLSITPLSYVNMIKSMIRKDCLGPEYYPYITPGHDDIWDKTKELLSNESTKSDEDSQRQKSYMEEHAPVTEAMLFSEPSALEFYGYIMLPESDIAALESMSFDYIPTTEEADDAKEDDKKEEPNENLKADKLVEKHKDSPLTSAKNATVKGRQQLANAYKHYKDAEDEIDDKLGNVLKKASSAILGTDRNSARDELVEGKTFKISSLVKTILGGYAVFSVSKVGLFLLLLTRWACGGKAKRAERKRIIEELEGELEVLERKIEYARYDNNKDAEIKLIRARQNVQHAINRIKQRDSAEVLHGSRNPLRSPWR